MPASRGRRADDIAVFAACRALSGRAASRMAGVRVLVARHAYLGSMDCCSKGPRAT